MTTKSVLWKMKLLATTGALFEVHAHLVEVQGQPVHDHVERVVEGEVVGHDGPHGWVAEQCPPRGRSAGWAAVCRIS